MLITRYPATYFDGKTPHRHEIELVVTPNGLRLAFQDGRTELWPYDELRQTQGMYDGEELRFERGLAAVVVADRGLLAAMHELAPASDGRVKAAVGGWRMVRAAVGAVVGLVVGGWGLYNYGLPALADAMAATVPVSWEVSLGDQALDQLCPPAERCTDAATLKAVEAVVEKIRPANSPYAYQVTLSTSEDFNAFALPGGRLIVNRGLLEKLKSPQELAGILAHEVQHVERRHTTKAICEDASTQVLIAGLLGNHDGFGQALRAAKALGELGHSRQAEAEADREGMKRILEAGLDPHAMVKAYEHLKDGDAFSVSFLSTHPDTEARIAELTAMAAGSKGPYQPIALPVAWSHVKRGCTP